MNSPTRLPSALPWLIGLAAVLFVFRMQLGSGLALLFGEPYDGNIAISVLEHWNRVAHGVQRWNVVGHFYPYPDTLGYNESYLLYALPYVGLRAAGLDPYLAAEAINVAVKAIGFLAFMRFAREAGGLDRRWATLGAVLFTLANNSVVQAFHAQLLAVGLAPAVALAAWRAVVAAARRRPAHATGWGCLFACAMGLWLGTAFYVAWFFGLFCLLVTLCAVPFRPHLRARSVWPILPSVVAFAVAATPFLLIYLPKAAETGLYGFAVVRDGLPRPADLLNLGPNNLLWGWLCGRLQGGAGPWGMGWGEAMTGFPPVLLGLGATGAVLAMRTGGNRSVPAVAWGAIGAATLLSLLLPLRFGGWSAWRTVFALVPGARAIRVVPRDFLVLGFPLTLLAVRAAARLARGWPPMLVAGLTGVLVAEQVDLAPPVFLDRPAGLALIRSIPPAPAGCEAFYVGTRRIAPLNGPPEIDRLYHHNVDAMLLSPFIGLPTINGFSTINPPDWDFAAPGEPDYAARVRRYAAAHRLHGLCDLDLATRRWRPGLP